MKKAKALLLSALMAAAPMAHADEGMWTLYNLPQAVYDQMKSYGFSLPYNDIYGSKDAIKNSVVLFGGFCSGVVVSPDGLVFTNHHCGFEAIRSHSTVEHDYMLKPISYTDFMKAVNKAVQWFELLQKAETSPADIQSSDDLKYIYVKSDYKLIQIELDKILYIEGLKDYIKIHLEDNPRPILSLVSMKMMEDKLPANRFIRIHRSFIVQKQKIKIIEKGRVVFGKDYIPISDSYKQELQNYVNKHTI